MIPIGLLRLTSNSDKLPSIETYVEFNIGTMVSIVLGLHCVKFNMIGRVIPF